MRTFFLWLSRVFTFLAGFCLASGIAVGAGNPHYLVTNDDIPPKISGGVSFYTVGTNGALTFKKQVVTGNGIAGGFFGADRINVLNNAKSQCIYASDAATGDVAGIVVSTLKLGGSAIGSTNDTGASNGIGLAMNGKYLYASFTDANTIGTFRVKA